ncbi:MAG: PDZ domain-containing protein [Thermoanaerobaculia bacterium]
MRRFAILITLAASIVAPSLFGASSPVRYRLTFPDRATHYVDVEETIQPAAGRAVELMMPIWTPGSYLVREYSQYVERIAARSADGEDLPIVKTSKNRWRIDSRGKREITLTYRVYARQMSVQGNWVGSTFAMLNGAPTFITPVDHLHQPYEVTVVRPPEWRESITALDPAGDAPDRYTAPDYDTLVDSPIYAGNAAVYPFEVDGKRHLLVNEGEGGLWDGERATRDVEAIVRENRRMWGFLPYDHYVFFNMIVDAGGGLEHKSSTLLMTHPFQMRTREGYIRWLGLVSHEYFHAWNVKRLRPVALGPFDYEHEVYTPDLWVAEGFTSYYGDLTLARAGLITREELLDLFSRAVQQVQNTPGRLVEPVGEASFDAWIGLYRRNENTANVTVSYYPKGEAIALLLDAKIRETTAGRRSLDDVMRLAFRRYAGARGYQPQEFRQTASEVAGSDLSQWFHHAVDRPEELDYLPALSWYGLRFSAEKPRPECTEPAKAPDTEPPGRCAPSAWLGAEVTSAGGRLVVSSIRRGSPAWNAGISVGDELLAFDDFRIPPDALETRLAQYRPGERVSLLVARRERLSRIDVTFGQEPGKNWKLEVRPDTTDAQQQHLRELLGR